MRGSASTLTRCTTPPSSTPAMIVNSEPDHGQPTVAIEGIGASRWVRVATPTGVS